MKPYYEDSAVRIFLGDAFEIAPLIGERFDLCLSDPPYGIGYDSRGGCGSATSLSLAKRTVFDIPTVFGDDVEFDPSPLFEMADRTTIWGAHHFYHKLPPNGRLMVWKKRETRPEQNMDFADCEICFDSKRGLVRVLSHDHNGFVRDLGDMGKPVHPTQKPLAVMAWCIALAGDSVRTIIDPMAGSCTTGRAAKDLGRKCVCIEREERYCEIGAKRMQQEVFAL